MKMNTLNLLFCLYVIVLVLMSIKYLFSKNKLSNSDIVIHLLVIVVLALLVVFTNRKKENFLNPSSLNYDMCPLKNDQNNNPYPNADGSNDLNSAGCVDLFRNDKVNDNSNHPLFYPNNNATTSSNASANDNSYSLVESGSPLNYNMGPYSGVVIDAAQHQDRRVLIPGLDKSLRIGHKNADCGNRGSPCDIGLFKNPMYTNPLGEEAPLNKKYRNGPSVDGDPNSPNAMFMFAHNKCHPGCCPSTHSCDHGCVCTTEKQREFIARGGIPPKSN